MPPQPSSVTDRARKCRARKRRRDRATMRRDLSAAGRARVVEAGALFVSGHAALLRALLTRGDLTDLVREVARLRLHLARVRAGGVLGLKANAELLEARGVPVELLLVGTCDRGLS